ncbi:MAG: lytic transglycosylase domain-containing protein [Paludibacter sp.]|nr:lytic transglycosylase domain-containing protein [Paludibacter sp.]
MRCKSGIILFLCICLSQSIFSVEPIYSFPIPSKMEFAGQSISLERYDMRERFDREQIVIGFNHSTSILIIKRANRFFPIIEPILKENGVPDDFKYLAVIECNLDLRAVSGAGAAGLWQLMPKTAQQFGLEVNDEVDERYHIERSTIAACKYFKSAYNKYKNWTTVAASYNAGMGRISSEKENQQVDEAFDLLLNSETSRYVFRILAMKQFLENPKAFGYTLGRDQFYQNINTKEILLQEPVADWTAWAAQKGISYSQLKDFNVWLRDRKLTNKTGKVYILKIPVKEDLMFNPAKIKIHNPMWVTF